MDISYTIILSSETVDFSKWKFFSLRGIFQKVMQKKSSEKQFYNDGGKFFTLPVSRGQLRPLGAEPPLGIFSGYATSANPFFSLATR